MMKKKNYTFLLLPFMATLFACGGGSSTETTTSNTTSAVADTSSAKMISPSGQTLAAKIEPETDDETLMQTQQETIKDRKIVVVKPNYALIVKADSTKENLIRYDFRFYEKNKSDAWELKTEEKNVLSEDVLEINNPKTLIRYEDFNGDGVKDLALLLSQDGRGNEKYRLWITHPDAHKMTRLVGFEALAAPKMDSETNIITTTDSYHGGQTKEKYRIEGDKMKFLEGEETIVDRKTQKSFTRKYKTKEK